MSKNLEDVIRELAARGEISHFSLVPSQKGKLWRGTFAMCSKFGVSFAEDVDPVVALTMALTTAKMKPARTPIRDQDLVPTIPQETVEVEPEAYVTRAEADEYLAGIIARDAEGKRLEAEYIARNATGQPLEDPAADLM